MHSWHQSVMFGEAGQQSVQDLAFVRVEWRQEILAVLDGDLPDRSEGLLTSAGQMQGVVATVGGVAASLDEIELFELVDQGNEPTGKQPQLGGERLL